MNKTGLIAGLLVSFMTWLLVAPASWGAVTPYSQDFEGLDAGDEFALGLVGGDGYRVFADVWLDEVGGTFLYNYGPFTAPNGTGGFSEIAGGEGGAAQGAQYLNVFSDYLNGDHGNGFAINTSVFQEYTIEAGDIGTEWILTGDYKSPSQDGIADPESNATASIFIVTLDPSAGFSRTNDVRLDVTGASPSEWAAFSLSLALSDPALEGQILQFGFNTTATNFEDSGVYYDNLNFALVPVPAAVWLFGSALGLLAVARRKLAS